MKKVILGTGMIICGVMGYCTFILRMTMLTVSPNNFGVMDTDPFVYCAISAFIFGNILVVLGFRDEN